MASEITVTLRRLGKDYNGFEIESITGAVVVFYKKTENERIEFMAGNMVTVFEAKQLVHTYRVKTLAPKS